MNRDLPLNPADIHGPNAGEPGYERIKRSLNQGGDDLYIGTREEIDQARAKAEAEGFAPDLPRAIRMHKKILIPGSELDSFLVGDKWEAARKSFAEMPNGASEAYGDHKSIAVYYKDANGNFAYLLLKREKIGSLAESSVPLREAMEKLGFKFDVGYLFNRLSARLLLEKYRENQDQLEQEKVMDEFSF